MKSAVCIKHFAILTTLFLISRPLAPAQNPAQNVDGVRARYTKHEFLIPMRDGVRLFTVVYTPKDTSQPYPFLLTRTPYSVAPYGVDNYPATLGPFGAFRARRIHFRLSGCARTVYVRRRIPAGAPSSPEQTRPKDIDESTDTYDTIEWLLKNIPNQQRQGRNDRRFAARLSRRGEHDRLSSGSRRASPQAPTADYYLGDDVYHNGAFMLAANFWFYSGFRPRGDAPQPTTAAHPFRSGHARRLRVLPESRPAR